MTTECKKLLSNGSNDKVEPTNEKPSVSAEGVLQTLDSGESGDDSETEYATILPDEPNLYKTFGKSMSNGFIRYKPSDKASRIRKKCPFAILLLQLIAERVNRNKEPFDGCNQGEAYIGDWKTIGASRQQARTAQKWLIKEHEIKIIETNRTRTKPAQKLTTSSTTEGTKVKLISSDIYDVFYETPTTDLTTYQPPINHDQDIKKISKDISSIKSDEQARPTKVEKIFFDWVSKRICGIEKDDLDKWKEIFPNVDVIQYLKFIEEDIGRRETKYKKRKRIVQTILIYFKNENENSLSRKNKYFKPNQRPQNYAVDTRPVQYNNTLSFEENV